MPYDGDVTRFEPVVVPVAKPFDFETATPDERLVFLAGALEQQQLWRDTLMRWDFIKTRETSPCGTAGCAIGLYSFLSPEFGTAPTGLSLDDAVEWYLSRAEAHFNMTSDEIYDVFSWGLADAEDVAMQDVTPGMVATAIRTFVADRQAAS